MDGTGSNGGFDGTIASLKRRASFSDEEGKSSKMSRGEFEEEGDPETDDFTEANVFRSDDLAYMSSRQWHIGLNDNAFPGDATAENQRTDEEQRSLSVADRIMQEDDVGRITSDVIDWQAFLNSPLTDENEGEEF